MVHVLGAIFVSGPKEAKSGNQKKNTTSVEMQS